MKKIFLTCISIFSLFILTGCGNKKLICTLEENKSDVGFIVETTIITKVAGDKVSGYDLEMNMTFDDEDLATSSYDSLVNDYTESDMKFKRNGKVITGKLTEVLSETITKKEFKEGLEGEGYTCK